MHCTPPVRSCEHLLVVLCKERTLAVDLTLTVVDMSLEADENFSPCPRQRRVEVRRVRELAVSGRGHV